MAPALSRQPVYIFLDEAGNLDFSQRGTKYFCITSVCKKRPFHICSLLDQYKFDLIEHGIDFEFFHCCQDNNHIKSKVFSILADNISKFRIDSVIVEKRKTGPMLREPKEFYPRMLGYLLRYVITGLDFNAVSKVCVITDTIPIQKKKNAIEKAVKKTLKSMLPDHLEFEVMHHSSKSTFGLQIADYCNWAINRKWEHQKDDYYKKITAGIKSEFDIFQSGVRFYY